MKTFRVEHFGTAAGLQDTLDQLPGHFSSVEDEGNGKALVHTSQPDYIEYVFKNQGYAHIIETVEEVDG